MSNFTDSELNEIKEIVKSQLQAKSSKEELRPKSKREIYFEQFNKIADLKLRERCKEVYDDEHGCYNPETIKDAINGICDWWETEEKEDFWTAIYNRADLETNPYIISKWKPELGGKYYIPDLNENKYMSTIWANLKHEIVRLERGLVLRTSKEAIEATDKMLEAIKK